MRALLGDQEPIRRSSSTRNDATGDEARSACHRGRYEITIAIAMVPDIVRRRANLRPSWRFHDGKLSATYRTRGRALSRRG
jgi:hypothetical protein